MMNTTSTTVLYHDVDDSEPDCKRYEIRYSLDGGVTWLSGPGSCLSVGRGLDFLRRRLEAEGVQSPTFDFLDPDDVVDGPDDFCGDWED